MHGVIPLPDPISCESLSESIERDAEVARGRLMDMIRFPSVQGHEHEMVAYTKDLLETLGLPAELRAIPDSIMQDPLYMHNEMECPYEGRHNLVSVQPGAGGGRSLIVQTHMDVVPGDDWGGYEPAWDGTHVIGRGATDCKGQLVMILLALKALREHGYEPAGKLEAQFVIEEEPGGNGALALIREGCHADAPVVHPHVLAKHVPHGVGAEPLEEGADLRELRLGGLVADDGDELAVPHRVRPV